VTVSYLGDAVEKVAALLSQIAGEKNDPLDRPTNRWRTPVKGRKTPKNLLRETVSDFFKASADSCLLCFQHKPTQGRGIAERNQEREKQTRDDLHQAAGFGVTEEIEKLDRLKSAGAISEAEYSRLRARLVQ
jgi:hypothetical protein